MHHQATLLRQHTTTDQELLLLRIDAAAARLAISRATLYRMIQRGEIPTIRIGSAVRVPVTALERWLAAQSTTSGEVSHDPRSGQRSRKTR